MRLGVLQNIWGALLVIVTMTFPFLALPDPVLAQDVPGPSPGMVSSNNDDILVEVQVGTQSAWSGRVPVKVRFGSKIAGQKIELIWRYPSALEGSQPASKFYRYEVNAPQVVENQIKPLTPGSQVLVVDVVVWGNDSNYINTSQVTLRFDEQLLLVPQTAAYRNAVLIRYAVLAGFGIGGLLVLFIIGKIIMKLIPQWLEREVNKV